MKLRDNKERLLYALGATLAILTGLELVGQLRGFFLDIWLIAKAIVGPVVIAAVFTYVLRPVVDVLVSRRVPRTAAILLIYLALTAVSMLLALNLAPLLVQQMLAFVHQIPGYVKMLDGFIDNLSFAARVLPSGVRQGLEKALATAEGGLATWLSGALIGAKDMLGSLMSALVIPFLVFYLLKDYSYFTELVIRLFRQDSRETVRRILVGIDESLGRYVRGQLLVMAIVGVATFVGLLIVKMPYALFLSVIVALTNIIPYLGPFLGAAPALVMAAGVSNAMFVKVLIVNLVVQQLEGNVFSPWIMGKTMNLHPLAILLAVIAGGEIGGMTGLIFAVPILAVVKVVIEQIRDAKREIG